MTIERALVVDDHPLVCEALQLAIQNAGPTLHVERCHSLQSVRDAYQPDRPMKLVALDLMLPDAQGFSGLLMVKQLYAEAVVVVVSAREEPATVRLAAAFGASGYLFKSTPLPDMQAVFVHLLTGAPAFPHLPDGDEREDALADVARRVTELTPSQTRIVSALANGRPNKLIAHDLSITEATVKAHMTQLFRLFGVANRAQLVAAVAPVLQPSAGVPGPL